MGTLEAKVDEALKALEGDVDAQADYLLEVVDLIQDYNAVSDCRQDLLPPHLHTRDETDNFKDFRVTGKTSKRDVLRRYLIEVEGQDDLRVTQKVTPTCVDDYICERCDASMTETIDACFVCPKCGLSRQFLQTTVCYEKEPSRKVTKQANYKRSNHMNEWLNTLMARESTPIPEDVLQAVRAELKKARITDPRDITPQLVYEYLKKLKLSKWYQHRQSICTALNGTPPPPMSAELEARLKEMFAEAEEPFEKWVRVLIPNRKNMLYYGLVRPVSKTS